MFQPHRVFLHQVIMMIRMKTVTTTPIPKTKGSAHQALVHPLMERVPVAGFAPVAKMLQSGKDRKK